MPIDMMKKVPVREQDPKVRATNFEEVCLGYNKEEAEAAAPTEKDCPYCYSKINIKATRCPHCTAQL